MNSERGGADKRKAKRLQSLILLDFLRAELKDAPIEWARYCARWPQREDTLSKLNYERLIQPLANASLWGVTFDGLLMLNAPEAGGLLRDCRSVYNILRDHYKKFVHTKISVGDIAKRLEPKRPFPRVALAITMLTRNSGANIGGAVFPISPEAEINGNLDLLKRSFTQRVRERRKQLKSAKAEQLLGSPTNLGMFGYSTTETWIATTLAQLGNDQVRTNWRKCLERSADDSDGAITAAKSLLESACKQVLHGRNASLSTVARLPELFGAVRKHLEWDPSTVANSAIQKILQGASTVVQGLGELRNTHGDSHGKGPGGPQPAQRHASLAVSMAGATAAFILATDDGKKVP